MRKGLPKWFSRINLINKIPTEFMINELTAAVSSSHNFRCITIGEPDRTWYILLAKSS